ncbi:hypothetical protein [Polaribacter sp. IC073]|uniref:hypothetical protein n=1 Tax=Polaribacter sp. IC073 TaxID=2508540 RepID=UPI0011BD6E00|nr:hypothetical protein [Polaribacter sp. IC073]TXD46661.1 hypothetical protein ES045_14090 [Polaribacter sp. IC073]
MLYYFIIGLQAYCLFHAYKNRNSYYWYFIIFFIPILGCIVYLITQVINKKEVSSVASEITNIVNPTKRINTLQKELTFSNTFQNKINLADAYLANKDFENAILQYEKALEGNFKDEPYTLNKLILCYFKTKNYDKVISYSEKINLEKDFKDTIYFYGLALEQKGFSEKAENELLKIDKRYSNYKERLSFSEFYIRNNKKEKAKELLLEIIDELKSMSKENYRKHSSLYNEATKKLNEM